MSCPAEPKIPEANTADERTLEIVAEIISFLAQCDSELGANVPPVKVDWGA